MKYKGIEDGTPTGEPLCRTCSNCVRIQGKAVSETLLYCKAADELRSIPLPFEAYECTKYRDKRKPNLYSLEKVAWILRSDNRTKTVGFVSPAQKEEHKKLIEENY